MANSQSYSISDLFLPPGTGEHGIGLGKRGYLRAELGQGTVELMKTIKRTIDPLGIMNPGKVSSPYATPWLASFLFEGISF